METDTARPAARRYSGAAVLGALAVGVGFLLITVSAVSLLFGAVGIAGGLYSRAQLRADSTLRGTFPSAVAFFGGVLLVGVATIPLVLPMVLVTVFSWF